MLLLLAFAALSIPDLVSFFVQAVAWGQADSVPGWLTWFAILAMALQISVSALTVVFYAVTKEIPRATVGLLAVAALILFAASSANRIAYERSFVPEAILVLLYVAFPIAAVEFIRRRILKTS
ncbi:MAG: hypothetical protein AAFN59_12840, partial [Pseudomonadota bacterium]